MTGGSALGFDWANRDRDAAKRIAHMEAIVRPWDHWDQLGSGLCSVWQTLRSQAGQAMILGDNFFVKRVLPARGLRSLSGEEMAAYRRPFAEPGERATADADVAPGDPIEGEPADVGAIVAAYADWLATSDVPKLFMKAEPALEFLDGRLDIFVLNAGISKAAPIEKQTIEDFDSLFSIDLRSSFFLVQQLHCPEIRGNLVRHSSRLMQPRRDRWTPSLTSRCNFGASCHPRKMPWHVV